MHVTMDGLRRLLACETCQCPAAWRKFCWVPSYQGGRDELVGIAIGVQALVQLDRTNLVLQHQVPANPKAMPSSCSIHCTPPSRTYFSAAGHWQVFHTRRRPFTAFTPHMRQRLR